jgi:hypothetical protein
MTIASTASTVLRVDDEELARLDRADISIQVRQEPEQGIVRIIARRDGFELEYAMLDIGTLQPGAAARYVSEVVLRLIKALDLSAAP